jgi:hypothetical protein
VTDVESTIDDETAADPGGESAPELIATHYLTSLDELIEHLRAADQLGLGVRVVSYLTADEDDSGLNQRWEFDLLTSSPVHEAGDEDA